MKRIQNRIAENSLTLPVMAMYAFVVWLLLSGLVGSRWWGQFACFAATTYLIVELSNSYALLRVRSRMVSGAFLALSCAACFLFGSLSGGIVLLCVVAAFGILFHTYQDKASPGWTYYGFLCLGLSTLVFVQMLYFVPLLWILMFTQLQSLSWRTWLASIVGLLTPYWAMLPWFIYQQELTAMAGHFTKLGQFLTDSQGTQLSYSEWILQLSIGQIAVFVLTFAMALVGMIHFWLKGFEDKIRIRQFYGFFTACCLMAVLFLVLQPQHYDVLMRLIIFCASPLIAHYFTFTHTRLTNIVFCVACVLAFLLMLCGVLAPLLSAWIPFPYLSPLGSLIAMP